MRDSLGNDEGRQRAIAWCKQTGITKVYVECFRDGYRAERAVLQQAMNDLRTAGFEVSGCVTTTKVGKPSTGWKNAASCYTDKATQTNLQAIFEYAASLADEIMIDDFWFTDCECPECNAARRAKIVTVGDQAYPVAGEAWEDYRCELMVRLSRDCILGPAKRVNPQARLIIKYPQWYDSFQLRGYEVTRETADFDRIWVGTETRDYKNPQWGGTPQFEGCFIMRWLGGIGGSKCGGGWFDSLGTTEPTYIEQARQTILGGARESMLFSYGTVQQGPGPKDIEALRSNLPELLAAAKEVAARQIVGVAAYKPPGSHPESEARVFDFVGMLGFPLAPCHEFPATAPAAFFSIHALKDPQFVPHLRKFVGAGKPALITDGLARALGNEPSLTAPSVRILPVKGDPKLLLQLDPGQVEDLQSFLLRPFQIRFRAPAKVALYLFSDRSWVAENFSNEPSTVEWDGLSTTIPARGWRQEWK